MQGWGESPSPAQEPLRGAQREQLNVGRLHLTVRIQPAAPTPRELPS